MPLRGRSPAEDHTFSFDVRLTWCRMRVRFDHVKLVEKPEDARHLETAIVTAYVFHPAYIRPSHPLRGCTPHPRLRS